MAKARSIEPRVYSSLNSGLLYDALEGCGTATEEVKNINCFVPLEDFNNIRYIVALLFYIGRLS